MRRNVETMVAIPAGIGATAIALIARTGVVESVTAGALVAVAARFASRFMVHTGNRLEAGDDTRH